MIPSANAGNTEPWYPTIGKLRPKISKYIGSAPPATFHALGSWGATSISPSTIPTTGVPPNFLTVDQATRAGKKINAVSVKTLW